MKSDVQRAGFERARTGIGASTGGAMLKALLFALSTLLLAPTSLRARQTDAPQVQTTAPPAAVEPAKWERFTGPGEEFSVELPETPSVHETYRRVNRTLRDYEAMRVYGIYSGGAVFIIASYDNPRDTETFDDFATYVWGSLNGLTAKGSLTLKGFAGKEYVLERGLGGARVFRTRKRAYLVWARSAEENHPSVARFLNSLVLEGDAPAGMLREDGALAAAPTPQPTARLGPGTGGGVGSGIGPGRGTGIGDGGQAVPRAADAPARNPDGPFRQNEVGRKAVVVYKPPPGFTEEARRNNVTGVVRLRVVFGSNGKVTNISVVKGLPDGLTEKAIAAARRMLFLPAAKDGRDVSQYAVLEYNFNIY